MSDMFFDESMFVWGVILIFTAFVFLPYLLKFKRQQRDHLEQKIQAESVGATRPQAQYPIVDESLCIGCGTCVAACPEGDVLGVVFGKATLVNGLRCIGHGDCEDACPVGAIEVGLGDISMRDDIPALDEFYQSNIPGLYIIGELGGISLIHNAIAQAKVAVDHIAKERRPGGSGPIDVVVVGAGPAGLTAALAAMEKGMTVKVLDQQDAGGTILQYPRRKLVMTQKSEIPGYGWLEREEYTKEELLEVWQGLVRDNAIDIDTGFKLSGLRYDNGYMTVISDSGSSFSGRNVILALGRRGTPRKLGIPGEELEKVMYQLIDAQSFQNQHILVVGGGDSAVEAAIALASQPGNTVTISYRKNRFFRIKKKNEERIREVFDQGLVTPAFDSNVLDIQSASVKLTIGEEERVIANDFVFIFAGGIPPFDMLREMGITFGSEEKALVA